MLRSSEIKPPFVDLSKDKSFFFKAIFSVMVKPIFGHFFLVKGHDKLKPISLESLDSHTHAHARRRRFRNFFWQKVCPPLRMSPLLAGDWFVVPLILI